jgi:hypothetical protein
MVMETALTAMEQYQVVKVELVYKTKVKASSVRLYDNQKMHINTKAVMG